MTEKYQHITKSLAELEEDAFLKGLEEAIAAKPDTAEAQEIVNACAKGMEIVGDYFEKEEYFVGDLIYAADILKSGMELLKPVIGSEGAAKTGKIVIGTAPGDLHDIGKNIFIAMMEASGFEVYDLGIDVSPAKFVDKVKEVNPDIVGISGLLTLAIDSMGDVISALKEAGVRDDVKVIIGGNPVSEVIEKRVGADAHSTNASTGVKKCKEWTVSK